MDSGERYLDVEKAHASPLERLMGYAQEEWRNFFSVLLVIPEASSDISSSTDYISPDSASLGP